MTVKQVNTINLGRDLNDSMLDPQPRLMVLQQELIDLTSHSDSEIIKYEPSWHTLLEPTSANGPGIGVEKWGNEGFVARFDMVLATVASNAMSGTPRHGVELDQNQYFKAVSTLTHCLNPRQELRITHRQTPDPIQGAIYTLRVSTSSYAHTLDCAVGDARQLLADITTVVAVGMPEYGFSWCDEPELFNPHDQKHYLTLMPVALQVADGRSQKPGFTTSHTTRNAVRLPLPTTKTEHYLNGLIPALLASPGKTEVRITLCGWKSSEHDLKAVACAIDQLANGPTDCVGLIGCEDFDLDSTQLMQWYTFYSNWLRNPRAVGMRVELSAEYPVSRALAQLVGNSIYQGSEFYLENEIVKPVDWLIDFSHLLFFNASPPALLPDPKALFDQGVNKHYPLVRFEIPSRGIVLGDIPLSLGNQEVRFPDNDRALHTYLIGATGTGKSTLMCNMIIQDIYAGNGVAVLDPHGDLHNQIIDLIPAQRRKDVVLVDFTDTDYPVGLNMLECSGENSDIQKGYIAQDMLSLFRSLFRESPEAFGPMYEVYMRNTLLLLMSDPSGDATLLDLPRIFGDNTYRQYLLDNCPYAGVRDFWVDIAEAAAGEATLSNIAPYIISKVTPFSENPLIKAIVGQTRTTINFREIMDQRKILLINLSKGLLSEQDTRFLGKLLTSRLFSTAMSRADMPQSKRTPFYTYIDEFQNFVSGSIDPMLAEARKYGLYLTLAHQNMAQLPNDLCQSVLANTGSKILLRSGVQDASKLSAYIGPRFTEADLIALPDRHAIARLQIHNQPTPAFLLKTRSGPESHSGKPGWKSGGTLDKSPYTRARTTVLAEIDERRLSYLEHPSWAIKKFSGKVLEYFDANNIRTTAELLSVLPESYEELQKISKRNFQEILLKKLMKLALELRVKVAQKKEDECTHNFASSTSHS